MQINQDRRARLHAIRLIVGSQAIESQENLLVELDKAGFNCTQTTLSRDLKQLRISKVRTRSGSCVYTMPREGQFLEIPTREEVDNALWRVQYSGNLIVVNTPPGRASMVAYDIDNLHHPYFLGTVAGDDTVIVVMGEDVTREKAQVVISEIVPNQK